MSYTAGIRRSDGKFDNMSDRGNFWISRTDGDKSGRLNFDDVHVDVNWNNLDNARPVVCFEHWCMTLPRGEFYMIDLLYGMIDRQELLIDLFHAYYAARLTKRNTSSQLAFEIDYEEQLIALCDELLDESYQIGPSMCFIVYDPVQREIFAASFRDRVVHHLIYRSIYDIIDRQLIHDAWSCRVGRGTHYGVRRIDHRIRSCSHNYSQDCYILKLDIQGFFMSIDKSILREQIVTMIDCKKDHLTIDYDFLLSLIQQVLFHDPTQDHVIKGFRADRQGLPHSKSLFHAQPGCGLPIGNLTSQLFANVYMNSFDHQMQYHIGCKHYGRYVDDFVVIHQDRQFLVDLIPRITSRLIAHLGLTLHPHKIYLQHYTRGVNILGAVIKPYRTYLRKRTLGNFRQQIASMNQCHNSFDPSTIISIINSYLGMCRYHQSYHIRQKLLSGLGDRFYDLYEFDDDLLVCRTKDIHHDAS